MDDQFPPLPPLVLPAPDSPAQDIRRLHSSLKLKEKKLFDNDGVQSALIDDFIGTLVAQPTCVDINNPTRSFGCKCMFNLCLEQAVKAQVISEILRFVIMPKYEQQKLVLEWMKYAQANKTQTHRQEDKHKCYILPGTTTTKTCRNALCVLLGIGRYCWSTCCEGLKNGVMPRHGLYGEVSNRLNATQHEHLGTFFEDVKQLAAPRATRIVRSLVKTHVDKAVLLGEYSAITDTRDDDEDVIELPTCYSKRALFGRLYKDHGWTLKFDNVGRLVSKDPVTDAVQTPKKDLPSWWTFLEYWNHNYPKVVCQRPREDICSDCFKFANSYKTKQSKLERKQRIVNQLNNTTNNNNEESDEEDTSLEDETEILQAAKHVNMAQAQRNYCNEKRAAA